MQLLPSVHLCIVFQGALHLGDVATVLLDLVSVCSVSSCYSRQTDDDDQICAEQTIISLVTTINGKMNVWKCKLIFPTDTLQQKTEITDLKLFFVGKNTCILINMVTPVCIHT